MCTRWLSRVLAGIAVSLIAARAAALTVIVPTDQPTIQGAVTAAGADGTVIINSDATFSETVTVTQSLTIHAGAGFTPTIRGTSACGVGGPSCTLLFEPNSGSVQTLAVSGVRFLPKSGTLGMDTEVVHIFNLGAGDAYVILDACTIENPEGFGFRAVDIGRASCSAGLNHVTVQNGSINIAGANELFTGRGGFVMAEGGSLAVSNQHLTMSGIAANAFDITGTPNCGGIMFLLSDSDISVSLLPAGIEADVAHLLLNVTATIERNTFQAISSNGEGFPAGILVGGGSGQTYSASVTLDANRFSGSGPNVGRAVFVRTFTNGSVEMTATNNVVHDMRNGFQIDTMGTPAGTVTATLTNNTVDGSSSDAIALNSASGSTMTVTLENNLLTDSGGWGVSLSSAAGGSVTVSQDYNGFFNNASGNLEAPLAAGAHDVVADPMYFDRDSGELRLLSGSPMIDAGDNSAVSTATDVEGLMRIQNGTVDIGAFEGGIVIITAPPTDTPTPSPTATGLPSSTPAPTHTASATPTATETAPTPVTTAPTSHTPTAIGSPCVGDCQRVGMVTIADLILGVNIALGNQPSTACPAFENAQGMVDIAQLIKGVNNALNGCGVG